MLTSSEYANLGANINNLTNIYGMLTVYKTMGEVLGTVLDANGSCTEQEDNLGSGSSHRNNGMDFSSIL